MQPVCFPCGRRWANGKGAFAQGIQHGQLFFNRQGGEALPEFTFALQDFGEIECHGASVRNCFSKRCHASNNLCREIMA